MAQPPISLFDVIAAQRTPLLSTDDTNAAASANTAAIQEALDRAGVIGIGRPGTYYVDAPLEIGGNTALLGCPGVKLQARPGMNAPVLRNKNRSSYVDENIHVTDIIFNGDKANQTVAFSTVDLRQVRHFRFERCQFNGALRTGTWPTVSSDGEGLVLRLCQWGYVSRCHAKDNAYDGFKTRFSTDIFFEAISAENNGRAGIQISYQDSAANPSERIHVNGITVMHSTGVPTTVAPTTSGVYLHTANRCSIAGVTAYGVRQGVGLIEDCYNNVFSNLVLRNRWTDRAAVHVEAGVQCSRNQFSGINIRPISGADGEYIRVGASCSFNSFRDVYASPGNGTGTWKTVVAAADCQRNQFSDGLLQNYTSTDLGTSTVFDNWVTY